MKDTHVNKLDSVLTDLPQEDGNFLGTEKYDQGLSRFIEQCSTPMTIAIQGDWGSGKTTTMKLVKGHLEGSFDSQVVKSIEVNTWQYSQMNLDDALVLNLLAEIVSEVEKDVSGIAGNGKATKIVQELMMASGAAAVAAGRTAAGLFLSSGLNDMLQAGWEAGKSRFQKKSETPENINFIKKVAELREEFQRSVNQLLNEKDKQEKGRIVIFVDDLDRLEPARAVEVMEAIKVFLDVKGCVFVLAVDFNVVKTGVRSKYVEIDDQKVQHIEEERINARQLEGPFLFEDLLAEYGDFKTALQPSRVQDWILEYEGQRFGILNVNKIKGFKINIEPTLFVAKGKEEAFSELLNRLQTGPEMMKAQKMTTAKYGSRENQVKIMVSDLKIGVDNQLIEEIASALGEVFGENM